MLILVCFRINKTDKSKYSTLNEQKLGICYLILAVFYLQSVYQTPLRTGKPYEKKQRHATIVRVPLQCSMFFRDSYTLGLGRGVLCVGSIQCDSRLVETDLDTTTDVE